MEYGHFCEDTALKVFVEAVMCVFKKGKLKPSTVFFKYPITLPVEGNDKTIERNYEDVSKIAQLCQLNLFIVARDYDGKPLGKPYDDFIAVRKAKLNIKVRNRTVFCIPVNCIEYWLYYIKHQNDETPPQPNSIENNVAFNCHHAKADIYDGRLDNGKYVKQSRETEKAKAEAILQNINVKKLRLLSPSFDNFMKQLEAVNL